MNSLNAVKPKKPEQIFIAEDNFNTFRDEVDKYLEKGFTIVPGTIAAACAMPEYASQFLERYMVLMKKI